MNHFMFFLLFQKETNPFTSSPNGHPGFLPQKVGKNTAVSIYKFILVDFSVGFV